MRSSNSKTGRSRRSLWAAMGVGLWGVSTLAIVALYDRLVRTEPPITQVVKHVHERPVIRVESAGADAPAEIRSETGESEVQPTTIAHEEQSDLDDRHADPEQRELERRTRFDRIAQAFESQPYSGAERPREAALQRAIDRGLTGLPAADGVRRGDVACRGPGCTMSVSFTPDVDFPSFDAAIRQATSTDAVLDEASGRRPLRSLHTYTDGDQVVGRYYFRWHQQ